MSLRKDLRKLDYRVVEAAIQRITEGKNHFSCIALNRATELYATEPPVRYREAYARNTWFLRTFKPLWWDSMKHYENERIQALADFRDAIVKARKPTFLERLKAWAPEPCSYANFS